MNADQVGPQTAEGLLLSETEMLTPSAVAGLEKQLAETRAALGSLEAVAAGPKQSKASRGPRNLPKPDARKARRQRVRAARRVNR